MSSASRRRRHARGRQRDGDRRADAEFADDRQRAAMQLRQRSCERKTEARAVMLPAEGGFHLPERRQHRLHIFGRDADARIADADGEASVRVAVRRQHHPAAALREFERIRQKIDDDLCELALVDPDGRRVVRNVDGEGNAAFEKAVSQERAEHLHQPRQRHLALGKFGVAGFDLREIEDVVDDGEEMAARFVNIDRVFAVAVHRVRAERLLRDHIREAQDRVERRAEFVAHIGEEFRFGPIGDLGTQFGIAQDELVAH